MWNIFWMQAAFYFGLAALFIYGRDARRSGSQADSVLFLAAMAALPAAHLFDLLLGPGLVRRWDDTELKELVIATGLLVYAIEIGCKIPQGQKSGRPL